MSRKELLREIRCAEEEIREIYESPKNKSRLKYWDDAELSSDYFHAIPRDVDIKPFIVECERPQYARILGFDFYEYYNDPYVHYLSGLQMQIFKFKNFDDCTPVVKRQPVYPSGAFERSIFFGDDALYTQHDAVIPDIPVIKEYSDLDGLKYPDFYTSGCMPRIIKLYEDVRSIAGGDFAIGFPVWGRSAWGCAWQMRRLMNLMYDVIEEPEWVDRLLRFLNDARVSWAKQQAEYLGIPLGPANIYNDEVLTPVVSPKLYGEKILPLEIELSEIYGGVSYWHSCGDTTLLFGLIDQIPNTQLITVSAWSDVDLAGKTYSSEKVLEVQLHNTRDVLGEKAGEILPERLDLIKRSTVNHKSVVVAGGLVFYDGYDNGMQKVRDLCNTAQKVLQL